MIKGRLAKGLVVSALIVSFVIYDSSISMALDSTAVPQAVPTTVPATMPTTAPTAIPTPVPTVVPTAIPTPIPTPVPTTVPTPTQGTMPATEGTTLNPAGQSIAPAVTPPEVSGTPAVTSTTVPDEGNGAKSNTVTNKNVNSRNTGKNTGKNTSSSNANKKSSSDKKGDLYLKGNDEVVTTVSDNEADESWKLILVNKQNPVPDDYTAQLSYVTGGQQVRYEVLAPLNSMLVAARKDGVSLSICSAYRSYKRQTELFNNKIRNLTSAGMTYFDAYRIGSCSVTLPGTSEHQLGMALDIVTSGYTSLDEGFGKTTAGKWLKKNAPKYGFILRYPEGKEHITGITYEPWHYRYVGTEYAEDITNKGLTLEEYLEEMDNN